MVHSIELLFDPGTEDSARRTWEALKEAGLRTPGQTSRPHLTLVVADGISSEVDELLIPITAQLPLRCRIGAVTLFPAGQTCTLVRLVIPTKALLSLQQQVHAICRPYSTRPAPNTRPGEWTPHVTLARRVDPTQLAQAVTIRKLARDVSGSIVGLRHWDGDHRLEQPIPHPDRR